MEKAIDSVQDGLPAFAGIVQGVVVHMAKHKSGKYSFNNPSVPGGALSILNAA